MGIFQEHFGKYCAILCYPYHKIQAIFKKDFKGGCDLPGEEILENFMEKEALYKDLKNKSDLNE